MIPNAKSINLKHQRLWLLPQKAVYWQKKKMLLVSDLHIGKSGHFRRNGIPVPKGVNSGNFETLNFLIDQLKIRHILFLGDLFHSHLNQEWKQFRRWRKRYPAIDVSLVLGNHDILPAEWYHASHISIFKRLKISPFLFVHDVHTNEGWINNKSSYLIGGHVHPAIKIKGKGRQKIKLPCFWFGKNAGILPAFGEFTGTAVIKPGPDDRTFLIIDEQILPAK